VLDPARQGQRPGQPTSFGSGRASPQPQLQCAAVSTSSRPQRGAGQRVGAPLRAGRHPGYRAGGVSGRPDRHRVVRSWRTRLVFGSPASAAPIVAARSGRTSAARSSWSRVRLSSHDRGRGAAAGPPRPGAARRPPAPPSGRPGRSARGRDPSAVGHVGGPTRLCATGPSVPSAAASMWLVVVLPLVPDTSTTHPAPGREPAQRRRVHGQGDPAADDRPACPRPARLDSAATS